MKEVCKMGIDLIRREEGSLWFQHFSWARILCLAVDYGWEPMGTIRPSYLDDPDFGYYDDEPWDGNYSSNDQQSVRAEDANALADALEKAMDDVSDQEIEAEIAG